MKKNGVDKVETMPTVMKERRQFMINEMIRIKIVCQSVYNRGRVLTGLDPV